MAEGVISRRGSEFASVGLKRTVGVRRGFNVGQGEPVQINTLIASRGNIETALPTSIGATSTLFAIPLDDTRILHIYTINGSGVNSPSAVVLTYTKSNNTTTIGPTNNLHTLLNSFVSMNNSDWGRQFSAVKLNDGRILLSFTGNPTAGAGSWRTMYAILSISGTTITMSGAGILNNTLSADTFDGLSSSQVVDNNRVLWLYRGRTSTLNSKPVASVLTISGNVVTTSGTNFVLDSVTTNTGVDLQPIEDGRFLATFANSSNHATILVLLVTSPDIITMGTTFIPVTNALTHASNKVGVVYPNIGIVAFPSAANTNQIFRYRIEGANLTFLNQTSFSTVSTSFEQTRVTQRMFVSVLRNGNILISTANSTSSSTIQYNLVWFDANLNNLNNTSPSASSTASSQVYTIVNTVLSQDYLLFWRNYGTTTSSLASRVEVYHNAAFSVQPVENFNTSTRIAFTTHAATSEQDVDIIVPPTSSQNPFNVI
jgi:hypothetical protein